MIKGVRILTDIEKRLVMPSLECMIDTLSSVDQSSVAWDNYINLVATYLIKYNLVDSLLQLVIKPVWDGDVISKVNRDVLCENKLASRIMYKGEFGYTSATYMGGFVCKACFEDNEAYIKYLSSKK